MNTHLFKLARECSFKSDYSGASAVRIGTVIVYKGSVLAKGWNCDKTHSIQEKYCHKRYTPSKTHYFPSKSHAETHALMKIRYLDIDFSKVEIYNYRELKDGSLANSRPCAACMEIIKRYGIKNIYYTTPDGYVHEELVLKGR